VARVILRRPSVSAPRLGAFAALAAFAALLLPLTLLTPVASAKAGSCGRPSGCNRYELIHSGSTYGWYPAGIRHEFFTSAGTRPPAVWRLTAGRADKWHDQFGTFSIEQRSGYSITDWTQARRTGRWEVRFRSKTGTPKFSDGRPYQVKLELVPAGPAIRCAPESILMAGYDPATAGRTAQVGVTRPGFRAAAPATPVGPLFDVTTWNGTQSERVGAWRVWAVEVARDHISWFLDGRVIRRENRPAALIGKRLHLRLSLLDVEGAEMEQTVTQLDWARYWTLKRTTKKPKKLRALRRAPGLTQVENSPAPGCSA
jgi:hypothetical protein